MFREKAVPFFPLYKCIFFFLHLVGLVCLIDMAAGQVGGELLGPPHGLEALSLAGGGAVRGSSLPLQTGIRTFITS